MDVVAARRLIEGIPMPLAELTARALNAPAGRSRHDAVFYLAEATLKLAASLRMGRWLDAHLDPSSPLGRRLETVVFPSLGHWCAFFRETGEALAAGNDDCFTLENEQDLKKTSSAALGAFAEALAEWRIADRETGARVRRRGVVGFFEGLVAYRNAVLGHGAQRAPKFYEGAGAALFAALAEVLRSSALFGGLRLAVAQVIVDARGIGARAQWRELEGMVPVPLVEDAGDARPGELYFRGPRGAVSIHPFVILAPQEREGVHFAFLNRAVERKDRVHRADYLDYMTSDVVDSVDAVAALAGLLTRLRGTPADVNAVRELAQTIDSAPKNESSPNEDDDVADEEIDDERNERTDLARKRVGITLRDRYRLEELLGIGGMAAVYRAVHRNGNRVAIKILHPDLAKNKNIARRFLKEGYAANSVDHPGALRVLDDDATDGLAFLVMDLLEGETVESRHRSEDGRLSVEEVCKIAHKLLDVLGAAHGKGIVHRDIKPENLFLTRTGELRVLDFGIARVRNDSLTAAKTRTGHAMGTPAYMPPEQALGLTREIDARTDLWAVGATMFMLLTGSFVHEAETVQQLLVVTATQPARSIHTLAPSLSRDVGKVIDRALSFAKADRFESARSMQEALESAYRGTFGSELKEPARAEHAHVTSGHTIADADIEEVGVVNTPLHQSQEAKSVGVISDAESAPPSALRPPSTQPPAPLPRSPSERPGADPRNREPSVIVAGSSAATYEPHVIVAGHESTKTAPPAMSRSQTSPAPRGRFGLPHLAATSLVGLLIALAIRSQFAQPPDPAPSAAVGAPTGIESSTTRPTEIMAPSLVATTPSAAPTLSTPRSTPGNERWRLPDGGLPEPCGAFRRLRDRGDAGPDTLARLEKRCRDSGGLP